MDGPRPPARSRVCPRSWPPRQRARWRGFSLFWTVSLTVSSATGHAAPPDPARSARRALEPEARLPRPESPEVGASKIPPAASDHLLHVRWPGKGCALGPQPELARRLRALTNPDDPFLSLELWGEKDHYAEGDLVPFYLRSPRRGYATLFWIGPDNDVFVVFNDVRVAGARDLSIDAGAAIVAPTGREQWVAVLNLEATPFPCTTAPRAHTRWLHALSTRAHGVGHWTITSTPAARRHP